MANYPSIACLSLPLLVLFQLSSLTLALPHEPFVVNFQWNYINYTWPNEETYLKAEKDQSYVERNNVISGVKFWRDTMYLTIPRWRTGVPVTLASTPAVARNGQTAPRLEPYPSWDMQRLGDCEALQFVQNVEIDPLGRMWVPDTGRTATLSLDSKSDCPPRLVILDLEQAGKVIKSWPIPASVADPKSVHLSDIVLDHEDGGHAYISDSDEKNPGIIVFSVASETFWKVSDPSMLAKKDAIGFRIEQTRVTQPLNVNGLALTPAYTEGPNRTLYYSPLSSFTLFALNTRALRDEASRQNVSRNVTLMGKRPSQSDGMAMSNTGILYFGLLADDAVSMWNSNSSTAEHPTFAIGQRIVSRDHHLMQWPDSFAFDSEGSVWCITNRLHLFLDDALNVDEPNFRAIKSRVNLMNYQYYKNGTAPDLPVINAAGGSAFRISLSSKIEVALATMLSLLVAMRVL